MREAKAVRTQQARALRRNATHAERHLWNRRRSRSLHDFKFVRQEPIGPYVVDFLYRARRQIMEIDGGQHAENRRDAMRDRWLTEHRYRILRFWNNDVLTNTAGVLEVIGTALAEAPPHPDRAQPSMRRLRKLACGAIRPLPASGERQK
ncbi:MAG TPA: DUF559 domain-containing protein [Xanthobacteraceae bacterium]|nr:DUF559 domain-containing protein [Xanthobacteraceae bacterium]